MPTHEQVRDAAERVHRTGERVSQARVLADLRANGIGCTERTIAQPLRAWLADQGRQPRPDRETLPEPLRTAMLGFMDRVWEASMAEALERLEDQRALLEREREAVGRLLDEAQVRTEAKTQENDELRARQAEMTPELLALRREVAHLRKIEFWDRVIREIAEFLPEREWMTVEEIARRLPPSLAQEALSKDKALTPGRINRQMQLRDHHGRYFERDEKGRYRRRKGWTGITQPPKPRRMPVPRDETE